MPCFHCDNTSSHEYKWNSTSCPDGVPRKKNGTSIAKAAVAIASNGDHKIVRAGTITSRGSPATSREREPPAFPVCAFSASFAPRNTRAETPVPDARTCSHKGENGAGECALLKVAEQKDRRKRERCA